MGCAVLGEREREREIEREREREREREKDRERERACDTARSPRQESGLPTRSLDRNENSRDKSPNSCFSVVEFFTALFAAFFAALFAALFTTSSAWLVPVNCRARELPFISQPGVYVK